MKKILLSTTAVVALAAMSTEASAADPIKLELGGFANQYITYANHDEVGANPANLKIGQWSDSEVHFKASTTLDNGLTVTSRIEREADSGNTGGDRSWLSVSSDAMGTVTLGDTSSITDDYATRAPLVGPLDLGDFGDILSVRTTAGGTTAAMAATANAMADNGTNGALSMKYASPSFSGVTVFAGYIPSTATSNDSRNAARATTHDESAVGIQYSGELSGASVTADVSEFKRNGTAKVTSGGLNVGMAGFTIGGRYQSWSDDNTTTTAAKVDGNIWELGVGYETGPYSVAAAYSVSKSDGTVATAGSNKDTAMTVGAAYDLGAGVGLTAQWYRFKNDGEGTTAAQSANAIVAGVEVGF